MGTGIISMGIILSLILFIAWFTDAILKLKTSRRQRVLIPIRIVARRRQIRK